MRTGASANGGGLLGLTLPRARSEASARHVLLVGSDLDRLDWLTELVGPAWDVSSTVLTAGGVPPVEGGAPAVVVLDGSPDPEAALIALRVLKDDSVMGAVPVILLAPPTGPTIELAHGLGALEVLPGPLDGDALLAALRRTASLVRRVEGSVAGRSLDPLTGLDTARALGVRLPGLVAACRAGGRPLPVVWVDVTDLRGFNLTHGWMQGDQLLLWIGGELRQRAGAGDLLARVGADGFALVMPGKNLGEASLISTGIREYLARTRPRLGVTRVAFQVRVDLVDFTQAGKQVEDRLSEIRAAGETEDVA
jgi:diguanylate cyclase (GGDEF)-like protein